MPEYLEEPRNPGKDDGQCAFVGDCGTKGLDEDARCHGCGYLVCEDHDGDPWGQHLVVDHNEKSF